jgi:hypothetical protein
MAPVSHRAIYDTYHRPVQSVCNFAIASVESEGLRSSETLSQNVIGNTDSEPVIDLCWTDSFSFNRNEIYHLLMKTANSEGSGEKRGEMSPAKKTSMLLLQAYN